MPADVNVKELREQPARYIAQVAAGEEIVSTRRGKMVARLAPPERIAPEFPALSELRASIKLTDERLSETVIGARREARYSRWPA